MLGGVRRQEGSRADFISEVSVSLACSSRFLSLWDKTKAPQELNSSGFWMEGEGGEEGDGGKAPEVVERDGWS